MKSDFAKYDRFALSSKQVTKIADYSAEHIEGTISEQAKQISIPNFVITLEDGVYFGFTNDSKLSIEWGNSLEVFFDYEVNFLNGKIEFTARHLNPNIYEFMPEGPQEFLKYLLTIYMTINYLSLNRPTVFATGEKQVMVPKVEEKNGKKRVSHYETKMVKFIRLNEEELSRRVIERKCECWNVAGFYRHYKSGKVSFVKPHRRGKKRNDPNALVPKTYQIPNERQK